MRDRVTNGANAPATRRSRAGGRDARRAARLHPPIVQRPALERRIPPYEIVGPDEVELVHDAAMRIVEEIGVRFIDEESLGLWRAAGAEVRGERVHIARELLMSLIDSAPEQFSLHARNPERTVRIGGGSTVFGPSGGAFVTLLDGVRRRGRKNDLETVTKIVHCLAPLHVTTGNPLIDVDDVPVPLRHLHQTYASLRWSDKPITANASSSAAAEDALAMCRIAFGEDVVASNTVVSTVSACNSPLKWDGTVLEGLKAFARAGQAVICTPFVLYGASTPPHVLGATSQIVAETLSGVALMQLIRPGSPGLSAVAPMGVSMRSGAPTWSAPEISLLTFLCSQMARRYRLPWRSIGPCSGAKVVDVCAGHDAAVCAYQSLLAGVDWISHVGGALEGAMHLNLGKLVLDAELMDSFYVLGRGIDRGDLDTALDMIRDLGDESHFLGADYTRENLPFMPDLQDNETHDTWVESGRKDGYTRGLEKARSLLQRYDDDPPWIDSAVEEALRGYVRDREVVFERSSSA